MTEAEVEASGVVFELENCSDVTLRWLELSGSGTPLVVTGEETEDVRIDDSVADGAIDLGAEVSDDAFVHVG
jgi:hypothetical protein